MTAWPYKLIVDLLVLLIVVSGRFISCEVWCRAFIVICGSLLVIVIRIGGIVLAC
jgi:hypothetical protein